MSVTIKQIAQETGLSVPTVSRILNKNGQGHRSDTSKRVLEIARRMGYRVNSSAQAIRRGRFGAVDLLLSTVGSRSILPTALLEGILDALTERDMRLVVSRLPDEKLTSETFMPRLLRESASDGLLINYNAQIPEPLIALIDEYQVPAMWINSRQAADCVYPDDLRGGREATEHLINLGHRRIAYVDYNTPSHYSTGDRRQGYLAAMRAHDLEPMLICPMPKVPSAEQVAYSLEWLSRPDRPTAVITYSSEMIPPVLYAAQELRLRVPEGLSLLTVDARLTEYLGKRLGTMLLPQYEMGQAAVATLLKKIEEPSLSIAPSSFPLLYHPGDTCAPPAVAGTATPKGGFIP